MKILLGALSNRFHGQYLPIGAEKKFTEANALFRASSSTKSTKIFRTRLDFPVILNHAT